MSIQTPRIVLPDIGGREIEAPRAAAISSVSGGGAGVAAAQQSAMRGFITPLHRKQKWVLTGESGRIVRQKMRWLKANSRGACASRGSAWEGPVRPDPDTGSEEFNNLGRLTNPW